MRLEGDLAGSGTDRDGATVDPFADLLFALAATVLPIILVLLPAIHLSAAGAGARDPQRRDVTVEGRPAWVVIAGPEGLRLPGEGNRAVPLDAITQDLAFRAALGTVKRDGRPLLLVVEPAGLESAFAAEPVLAAFGPERIEQVRATTTCGAPSGDAMAAACGIAAVTER